MRSSKSEDLNIQSNFTSSFLSKSCRLPREQCSVTTANMEQSAKKPKKGFTFSFLRSFICQCKPTGVKKHIAQYYRSRCYFIFFGLYYFYQYLFFLTLRFGHLICVSHSRRHVSVPLWKSWWCSASLLWNVPLEISSATPSHPGRAQVARRKHWPFFDFFDCFFFLYIYKREIYYQVYSKYFKIFSGTHSKIQLLNIFIRNILACKKSWNVV